MKFIYYGAPLVQVNREVQRFRVHHQNPIDHLFHLIQEVQQVHDFPM